MASSEVDQKFLGRLAKAVENDNHLLSAMLFKILGLSQSLAEQLVAARKERRPESHAPSPPSATSLRRVLHILWLSREGHIMLHQYVIPMVGNYVELKVLAYKLRASFYHIFVLFHNNPPVSTMGNLTPEMLASAATPPPGFEADKYRGAEDIPDVPSRSSSIQPTHPMEGGPVGPPPGFEINVSQLSPSALLSFQNYLPIAHQHFKEASALADDLLWGSHSLRLSVKTEYAAFLYECARDAEASRQLAKASIAEAYDAEEGMTDDMFKDTCELVTVLGKMMKRGLKSNGAPRAKESAPMQQFTAAGPQAVSATGMENAI